MRIFIIFICVISVSCQDYFGMKKIFNLQENSTNNQFESEIKKFQLCLKVMTINLTHTTEMLISEPVNLSKELCKVDISNCFKEMENYLKSCERCNNSFTNRINVLSNAQKYMCSNDGKALANFFSSGIKCFGQPEFNDDTKNDFNHFISDYIQLHDSQVCRFAEIGMLSIEDADTCENKTVTNFLDNLVMESFKNINCK